MTDQEPIGWIREHMRACPEEKLKTFIDAYASDGRSGVKTIVEQARRKLDRRRREEARIDELMVFEREAWQSCQYVAGMDEVGRGALAGPVAVGVALIGVDAAPVPEGAGDRPGHQGVEVQIAVHGRHARRVPSGRSPPVSPAPPAPTAPAPHRTHSRRRPGTPPTRRAAAGTSP